MVKHLALPVGLALCAGFSPVLGQVCAQTNAEENLTITVTGEAKGTPDTMYIGLASEATAGNAADAFQQCKQKADAAVKAIGALGVPNSEIIREMYEFSSATAASLYSIVQPAAAPAGTRVSQVIEVKVKIEEGAAADDLAEIISRVLDAANKAGVGFKQPTIWQAQVTGQGTVTPISYILEDATPLRKQAVADSLSKAAEIKDALAKSGVKAGKLLGVGYVQAGQSQAAVYWPVASLDMDKLGDKAASSSSPERVTVRCSLSYTYEVVQSNDVIEVPAR